jgi:coenzyme PQQ biosynthesis protein PqqD
LLVPEGALSLQGPAREILAQLDGKQTVSGVVGELCKQYPGADASELQQDVMSLLERMKQRGVVRV